MAGGQCFTMGVSTMPARMRFSVLATHRNAALPSASVESGGGASNSAQVLLDRVSICPDKLGDDWDENMMTVFS